MTSTKRPARLLVVEHEADAGLGFVGERLEDHPIEVVVVGPHTGNEVPDSIDGFSGLIVLGGSSGPTDDDIAPWLPATRQLLADAVEREVPTLGICLGAQLLATATGGRVQRMQQGPEVGVHEILVATSAHDDPLLGELAGKQIPVVQWHWLEADRLPEGAEVLASSTSCVNQAYRLGSSAWGVQFHPEALGDTAQDWTRVEDLTQDGLDPDTVVRGVREAESRLRETWAGLADRFAALVIRS